MTVLNNWSNTLSRLLNAAQEVSGSISSHGDIIGDAREVFLRDILSRFVPKNTYIGTGQIVDINGGKSKQIDIILYRSDFPVFQTLGQSEIFLLEGVVATIEVKSSLNPVTLNEALENCLSIKKLNANVVESSLNEYIKTIPIERFKGKRYSELDLVEQEYIHSNILPPTYIFGYKGYKSKLKDFSNACKNWLSTQNNFRAMPQVIVTEGCVGLDNRGIPYRFPTQDSKWHGFVASKDEAPLRFMLSHLIHQITHSIGMPIHAASGVRYSLKGYIDLPEVQSNKWQGVWGTVE